MIAQKFKQKGRPFTQSYVQLNFAANIAKRIEKVVAPKLAYLLSQSKTHYLDEPVRLSRYDLDE